MKCLSCNSKNLYQIYNFGLIPLVNNFQTDKCKSNQTYPLVLAVCNDCFVCQLVDTPPEEIIFTNYKHFSSASSDNVKHIKNVSEFIHSNFDSGIKILEIGCNDGTLLNELDNKGYMVQGVDPAKNMSQLEIHRRLNTIFEAFSEKIVPELLSRNPNGYDLIIGLNVFAHFRGVQNAFDIIPQLLTSNGVFMIEVAYAIDTVFAGVFDTVYHEHVFNHTLHGLNSMFKLAGLKMIAAQNIPTQGGSLRVFATRIDAVSQPGFSSEMESLFLNEKKIGLDKIEFYQSLNSVISNTRNMIKYAINSNFPKKSTIIIVGAPARGVILMNSLELDSQYNFVIVDDTTEKLNCYFPGINSKVNSWADMKQYYQNTKGAIVLSWNYKKTMIEKLIDSGFKGKVLVPFPQVEILEI